MNKAYFTIARNDITFAVQLFTADHQPLLVSKHFPTYRSCERFIADLKLHLCFHANFYRTKRTSGAYGFDIRTCWDELIATSTPYFTRMDREDAMQTVFAANKEAVFIHTSIQQQEAVLQHCA